MIKCCSISIDTGKDVIVMKWYRRYMVFLTIILLFCIVNAGCKKEVPIQESEQENVKDLNSPRDNLKDPEILEEANPFNENPLPIQPVKGELLYVVLQQIDSSLNIREEQSMEGQTIGKLKYGDEVEVLLVDNGWAKIRYQGITGYVSQEYLKKEQPDSADVADLSVIEDVSDIENVSDAANVSDVTKISDVAGVSDDISMGNLPSEDVLSNGENEEASPLANDYTIPEEGVFIEVFKEERVLKLWENGTLFGEYPIGLGFSPVGHKGREGDGRTPEGSYYVCVKNPNSRFYLSLGVSYPNSRDAQLGLEEGTITQEQYDAIISAINLGQSPLWNTALGGEIMIHGHGSASDWTAGCVAVNNDIMDILWEKCSQGTKIQINP